MSVSQCSTLYLFTQWAFIVVRCVSPIYARASISVVIICYDIALCDRLNQELWGRKKTAAEKWKVNGNRTQKLEKENCYCCNTIFLCSNSFACDKRFIYKLVALVGIHIIRLLFIIQSKYLSEISQQLVRCWIFFWKTVQQVPSTKKNGLYFQVLWIIWDFGVPRQQLQRCAQIRYQQQKVILHIDFILINRSIV